MLKERVKLAFYIVVAVLLVVVLTSFLIRPELYCPNERRWLKYHIENGEEIAIDYYEDMYTSKGIYLFGEN